MKANAVPLLALFEKKMRLEVPLFQRQYVWSRESQWEPLWEDIARKFTEYLEGRKDAPVHFLGAMVLDPGWWKLICSSVTRFVSSSWEQIRNRHWRRTRHWPNASKSVFRPLRALYK